MQHVSAILAHKGLGRFSEAAPSTAHSPQPGIADKQHALRRLKTDCRVVCYSGYCRFASTAGQPDDAHAPLGVHACMCVLACVVCFFARLLFCVAAASWCRCCAALLPAGRVCGRLPPRTSSQAAAASPAAPPAAARVPGVQYGSLSTNELKEVCKDRGLSTKGQVRMCLCVLLYVCLCLSYI